MCACVSVVCCACIIYAIKADNPNCSVCECCEDCCDEASNLKLDPITHDKFISTGRNEDSHYNQRRQEERDNEREKNENKRYKKNDESNLDISNNQSLLSNNAVDFNQLYYDFVDQYIATHPDDKNITEEIKSQSANRQIKKLFEDTKKDSLTLSSITNIQPRKQPNIFEVGVDDLKLTNNKVQQSNI